MLITIGNKTKEAMICLGIVDYPFTKSELKHKFNSIINKEHPDKGGNEDKAKEIISAYSLLKNTVLPNSYEKIEVQNYISPLLVLIILVLVILIVGEILHFTITAIKYLF